MKLPGGWVGLREGNTPQSVVKLRVFMWYRNKCHARG